MKIEVTVKLIFDLGEFSGSIEDNGLNEELEDITVQSMYEDSAMTFQSDDDEDKDKEWCSAS